MTCNLPRCTNRRLIKGLSQAMAIARVETLNVGGSEFSVQLNDDGQFFVRKGAEAETVLTGRVIDDEVCSH